jgi:hypothetical protein
LAFPCGDCDPNDQRHYTDNHEKRDIQACVIEGFDLSCSQFAFRRDNSGEVLTTPLGLYSLLTGKAILCNIDPVELKNQCTKIMERTTDHHESRDRIVHRIIKYTNLYGYTLQAWDTELTNLVRKCHEKLGTVTSPVPGIYEEAGRHWDKYVIVCERASRLVETHTYNIDRWEAIAHIEYL